MIETYLNIKHPGYIGARGRACKPHSIDQYILGIYKNIKGQISAINFRKRKTESVKALEQKLESLIQKCAKQEDEIRKLESELARLQEQINQQNK